MKFYPVILTDSITTLQKQINKVKNLEQIKTIQIDLIDDLFARNITVGLDALLQLDFANLQIDLHLMVNEPINWVVELNELLKSDELLKGWVGGKNDKIGKKVLPIRAIIAQLEHMSFQQDFVEQVHVNGWQVGLSLDLYTPIDAIDENILPKLDIVQVMGVEAGLQGQEFNERALVKIKQLATLKKDWQILVDGGVKLSNASIIKAAGATGLVVGSALWQANNIEAVVSEFLK